MKRKWLQWILGCLIVALLVGGPVAYSRVRHATYRNFRVVEDGKVYRSGQLNRDSLLRLHMEYQFKTVLSLRYADDHRGPLPPDWWEEKFCADNGIRHVRIRPQAWHGQDKNGNIPAETSVREFLNLMDDPNVYPVLIHCFAGKHRTGSFCAIYRMEYQHWSNADAMRELKAMGYATLDEEPDVQTYMDNYVPRWKRSLENETSSP